MHGKDFINFNQVLDEVMQERSEKNLGIFCKQAKVISLHYEDQLWKQNILGKDTPNKLRNTVLFILGVNLALHAGYEHYPLRKLRAGFQSQLNFKKNTIGLRCLVYTKHTITKTNGVV